MIGPGGTGREIIRMMPIAAKAGAIAQLIERAMALHDRSARPRFVRKGIADAALSAAAAVTRSDPGH